MAQFLALQEFRPREKSNRRRCIWCKSQSKTNRAHIISRKLTLTSHATTVLKSSICTKCNSDTSKIESWILQNTPLAWARFFLYMSGNPSDIGSLIPSYVYSESLHNWLVFDLLGKDRSRRVLTQLLLTDDKVIFIAGEEPERSLDQIKDALSKAHVHQYINENLPSDFSNRFVLTAKGLVAIARKKTEAEKLRRFSWTSEVQETVQQPIRVRLEPGQERQHFRWSRQNWAKLCAKIAFEMLSLCEGASKCTGTEFDTVRRFVLSGPSKLSDEVIFDATGPIENLSAMRTINVDLSNSQKAPVKIVGILPNVQPGMHSIALYEFEGYICGAVSVSGLPPSIIVLAGPDCHLNDLYLIIYDEVDDKFSFSKLAYDQERPIIPLTMKGDLFETLAKTYRLKPIST
jgi:hypothetical protein